MSDVERAAATTKRYRQTIESGDVEGFLETLAPAAVLHSPITARVQFTGRDEIRPLMHAVFASIDDISYFEDVGDAHTRALFYTARVGRQTVEEATLVRLDDDALITEVKLWFRPLPGLTAVMGALGPNLVRTRSRRRAIAAKVLTAPLVGLARVGDVVAVKLLG